MPGRCNQHPLAKTVAFVSAVYPYPADNGKKVVIAGFLRFLQEAVGAQNITYVGLGTFDRSVRRAVPHHRRPARRRDAAAGLGRAACADAAAQVTAGSAALFAERAAPVTAHDRSARSGHRDHGHDPHRAVLREGDHAQAPLDPLHGGPVLRALSQPAGRSRPRPAGRRSARRLRLCRARRAAAADAAALDARGVLFARAAAGRATRAAAGPRGRPGVPGQSTGSLQPRRRGHRDRDLGDASLHRHAAGAAARRGRLARAVRDPGRAALSPQHRRGAGLPRRGDAADRPRDAQYADRDRRQGRVQFAALAGRALEAADRAGWLCPEARYAVREGGGDDRADPHRLGPQAQGARGAGAWPAADHHRQRHRNRSRSSRACTAW